MAPMAGLEVETMPNYGANYGGWLARTALIAGRMQAVPC